MSVVRDLIALSASMTSHINSLEDRVKFSLLGPRQPEDTLAAANQSLDAARMKFDAAAAHAAVEQNKKDEEIDALATIIAGHQQRLTALQGIANTAAEARDFLGGVSEQLN